MNPFLDLISSLLALAFRIVTSPLLLLLYCIGGVVTATVFLQKWISHFSFRPVSFRRPELSFSFKKHFQLSQH